MASWQSAVVHPLGLAGYALACVFGVLAKFGPTAEYPWLGPVAIGMAFVALLGGLFIALRQSSATVQKQCHPSEQTPASVNVQSTSGENSPAIADVKGSVRMHYGDEIGKDQQH